MYVTISSVHINEEMFQGPEMLTIGYEQFTRQTRCIKAATESHDLSMKLENVKCYDHHVLHIS